MKIYLFFLIALLFLNVSKAQIAQWRGPDRSGKFPNTELLTEWPENGPEMILKVEDLGSGYSSPVMFEGVYYITGKKDTLDYISAIDQKGNLIYQVNYGRSWMNSYPETRCTPTILGGHIYLISGAGEVVCLNRKDGSQVWRVNAYEKYKGEYHSWGVAESPLVIDDKVIYTNGGDEYAVLAFNKDTGDEVWKSKSLGGSRTYVSPIIYQNEDVRLIIALTANHVLGISPENGDFIWQYKYLPDEGESSRGATNSTNSPIVKGNEIFVSKGYNQYGVMLTVSKDGKSVEEKWRTYVMDTHHGHYVNVGDYIYGSNWENNSKGKWVCIKWETGEVMYEEKWHTKGPIMFTENLLYCYEERSGNFALVRPVPEKFDIVSSFKIEYGTGPHWAHPQVADGKLLMRHGEVLMVFNIKK